MMRLGRTLLPVVLATMLLGVAASTARADVQGFVQEILDASNLGDTKVGVLMVDVQTGETLAAVNAVDAMIPASNMKLVTTAAALGILGPDFVFRTELRLVRADDFPADGRGDAAAEVPGVTVVVKGDGDPAFCEPELLAAHGLDVEDVLAAWVGAVRKAGETRIDRLVIDDRIFDQEFVHEGWPVDQLNRSYCAQVAGLNFYANCLDITAQPTAGGLSPRITIAPRLPDMITRNLAKTGNADTFWIERRMGTNQLTFRGQVRARGGAPKQVTVHDPPMVFADVFALRLREAGIEVGRIDRALPDESLPEGTALHVFQTTLPVVLARTNKDSQNLFAEALLKRIARHVTGQPGSWSNGSAAVRVLLRQKLGAPAAGIIIADGSGMSRENSVSPLLLCRLLTEVHKDQQLGPLFRDSLSVGGEDGTLENRFARLTGTVYGKSGYINGVSCLSGYLVMPGDASGEGGRTVAFSLMFNDFKAPLFAGDMKRVQNELVAVLDRHLVEKAEASRLGG